MNAALGMKPEQSSAENRAAIMAYFAQSHPYHAARRSAVERASKVLDLEFKAPAWSLGGSIRGWVEQLKQITPHIFSETGISCLKA
jgi:hypothetical protein